MDADFFLQDFQGSHSTREIAPKKKQERVPSVQQVMKPEGEVVSIERSMPVIICLYISPRFFLNFGILHFGGREFSAASCFLRITTLSLGAGDRPTASQEPISPLFRLPSFRSERKLELDVKS